MNSSNFFFSGKFLSLPAGRRMVSPLPCVFFVVPLVLSSCSMGEEMRRIEESKVANKMREASRSSNLTGEQIFVRSCNTCHPGGDAGMGPSLINMEEDFKTDEALRKFIRQGKGMMPPQPVEDVNDEEMKSLIVFLHGKVQDLKEAAAKRKLK